MTPSPVWLGPLARAGRSRHRPDTRSAFASNALIVSISGDGKCKEVVNGVLSSSRDEAVSAALDAGNANDNSRVTGRKQLAEAIRHIQIRRVDLLRLSIRHAGGL
ncbi:diacylglycerol kinase family protein [Arthrobacter sp. NPDC092385]|uniref:diacylglycerol kinase family protein n=1 Tax=Arthrobacter sp. NPDC092385 TaxID=3363943 RepID=UPI0038141BFA